MGQPEIYSLELAGDDQPALNIGAVFLDPATDTLRWKFRSDLPTVIDEHKAKLLAAFAEDFTEKARNSGGEQLLDYLEHTAPGPVRLSRPGSLVRRTGCRAVQAMPSGLCRDD